MSPVPVQQLLRAIGPGLLLAAALHCPLAAAQSLWPGFQKTSEFNEQLRWSRLESGVRVAVLAPQTFRTERRLLVIFATPNGNTIEQTLGCASGPGRDWQSAVQHVAAQIRQLRALDTSQDIVLAVVQAPQLSWPSFRREQPQAEHIIRQLVADLQQDCQADRVALTCHSGGGSFLWGFLNAQQQLPDSVERIVFLDANYSYSSEDGHGDKLLAWLQGNSARRLIVTAYDDRHIRLNGQLVVGPDGGTWRASQRMMDWFQQHVPLSTAAAGPFQHTRGLSDQLHWFVHPNPDNRILHTALVGEMNGVLHSLTLGTPYAAVWGTHGGPPTWTAWVQAEPFAEPAAFQARLADELAPRALSLPPRSATADSGTAFRDRILNLPAAAREQAVRDELLQGNLPACARQLVPLQITAADSSGNLQRAIVFVMSDYLAIGSDSDFLRIPLQPDTAAEVAAASGCQLITPRISEAVFAAATLRLEPAPLTTARESVATFFEHQQLIEQQLQSLGADSRSRRLLCGLKKDVVLTRRLQGQPERVALYGWHRRNGSAIQPLYVGHARTYVDYSHGVRLMSQQMLVNEQPMDVATVLQDERLHSLLSDEGPLLVPALQVPQ